VNYSIALPGLVETSSKELQEILGLHYNREKYSKTLANQYRSFTVTIPATITKQATAPSVYRNSDEDIYTHSNTTTGVYRVTCANGSESLRQ